MPILEIVLTALASATVLMGGAMVGLLWKVTVRQRSNDDDLVNLVERTDKLETAVKGMHDDLLKHMAAEMANQATIVTQQGALAASVEGTAQTTALLSSNNQAAHERMQRAHGELAQRVSSVEALVAIKGTA